MAKADKQIVIELAEGRPTYKFGKDLSVRDITNARTMLSRGYRAFLRSGNKLIDPAVDLAERKKIYDESVALEEAAKLARREEYLAQQKLDNGKEAEKKLAPANEKSETTPSNEVDPNANREPGEDIIDTGSGSSSAEGGERGSEESGGASKF